MHHLHDQVANPQPSAEPEANPASIAFSFALKSSFTLTKPIGGTWRDQRNAVAHCIAGFRTTRRHRWWRF